MTEDKPGSARAALRKATAADHERLHHVAAFATLAAGEIQRSGYRDLLERLYGFHAPMEATIRLGLSREAFGLGLNSWGRAALLRRDLTAIGALEAEIAALPLLDLSDIEGEGAAQAMGRLYVVEGSTIGGRLLARHLDHILSNNSSEGRLFLLAGADPHHIAWRDVCKAVEVCGSDPVRRSAMITAALDAFARFGNWFGEERDLAAA